MSSTLEKHSSYGMLGFGRRTGSPTALFGSSIQHKDTIVMTLKHGELDRKYHTDYTYGRGVIAEVEMSYSQFVEAITNMNVGDGVPCTVRYTEKDGYAEKCPFVDKKTQFEQEFANQLSEIKDEVGATLKEVRELFDTKASISKKDREDILKKLQHIYSQVGSNTEFVYSSFNEQMNKTVQEAKGEVEAFCQNKLYAIAQEQLVKHKDDFKELESPVVFNIDEGTNTDTGIEES